MHDLPTWAMWVAGTASLLSGAIWRRLYGGWLAFPRAPLLTIAVILFSLPAWYVWHSVDTCWRPMLIMAGIALQFCLGVQFDDFWDCLARYSIGPCLVFQACLDWAHITTDWGPLWVYAIGPAIAAVYYLGKRSTDAAHPWAISWPWDTPQQQMTAGYTTFGELAAGGLSAVMFVLSPLMRA